MADSLSSSPSPSYSSHSKASSFVLYVDHQSHPVPLSVCFHATASRRLSSSVARYPPCSQTEIDSAFCPQCLSFHDASSAAALGGNCPRPSCRRCPMCTAVATVYPSVEEQLAYYKCGYCSWTSKECHVIVEILNNNRTEPDASPPQMSKEQILKCAEDLGEIVQHKISQATQTADEQHGHMVTCYQKIFTDEERRERQGYDIGDTTTNALRRAGSSSRNLGDQQQHQQQQQQQQQQQAWNIDSLEKSLQTKKEKLRQDSNAVVGGRHLERLVLDDEEEEEDVADYLKGVSKQAIDLQAALTSLELQSRADFYPLPMPLRTRKSRRCRAELQNGRPGILVKPKLNPLEGDTSLRSGHGQWWKKDSSAIHVVPRVKVVHQGTFHSNGKEEEDSTTTTYHAFLLRVKNPTLGKVRIRFGPSEYQGEVGWDPESDTKQEILEDMLVDTLSGQKINAQLSPQATQDLATTDTVELDSVEDAFLELGKKQTKNPAEVLEWNTTLASEAFRVAPQNSSSSSMRLIAKQNDSAWFEFVCVDNASASNTTTTPPQTYSAVPIALQVQVGDGCWESSLVKPLPTKDNEPDFVSFDLVVTWTNNNTK